jgi:hypothetical protein
LFEKKDSIKIEQTCATFTPQKQFFVPEVESNYNGAIKTVFFAQKSFV